MIARPYFKKKPTEISWLKNRGYLHITPQLDVIGDRRKLLSKITNKSFVSNYSFFPLIHSVIKERRYKKVEGYEKRRHSYKTPDGIIKRNDKLRPLHYAAHFDSLIFGYYAEIIQNLYEQELLNHDNLSQCIIAYRKIKSNRGQTNKSTIHFASEVFDEIKMRGKESCSVLMFDIKSYFSSIDHELLKVAWAKLLGEERLPPDHYNVFKASTQFSYILLDDLRIKGTERGQKQGFDEKRLSEIRNKHGVFSFFESAKEFRETVKTKKIRIHKYPFRNNEKQPIGIPQGLPISATLANLYLLDFDLKIKQKVIDEGLGFYRRYSDDIIVICKPEKAHEIESFVLNLIRESKVEISEQKTDRFLFRSLNGSEKITSIRMGRDKCSLNFPLSYLGFEFYGDKTLVKSANLARFYRRMIFSVRRKIRRAKKIMEENPNEQFVIYRSQLKKLYSQVSLKKTKIHYSKKFLKTNELGAHRLKIKTSNKKLRSNYISYIRKASRILNEPSLNHQVSGHQRILNQAIQKFSTKDKKFL